MDDNKYSFGSILGMISLVGLTLFLFMPGLLDRIRGTTDVFKPKALPPKADDEYYYEDAYSEGALEDTNEGAI